MPTANGESQPQHHVPAWKRLGLKLKSQNESPGDAGALYEAVTRRNGVARPGGISPDVTSGPVSSSSKAAEVEVNGLDSSRRKRRREADASNESVSGKRSKGNSTAYVENEIDGDHLSARSIRAAVRNPWSNASPDDNQQAVNQSDRPKRVVFSPEISTQNARYLAPSPQADSNIPGSGEQTTLDLTTAADSTTSNTKKRKKKKSKSTLLKLEDASSAQPPSQNDDEPAQLSSDQTVQTPHGRRKSVAFTPDTKTTDGDSNSRLSKSWADHQRDYEADLETASAQEPAATTTPKAKKERKPKSEAATAEDPVERWAFVRYLHTYATDRPKWKFNKSQQTDLLKNAFNMWRVPPSLDDALLEYVTGLQGIATRDRLRLAADAALQGAEQEIRQLQPAKPEAAEEGAANADPARKAARDEALRERLRMEKKRRRDEAELEYQRSDAFRRLLAKRRRAERILESLGAPGEAPATAAAVTTAKPAAASSTEGTRTNGIAKKSADGEKKSDQPRKTRRRKQRSTGVPDDELTSSSEEEVFIPSPAQNSAEEDKDDTSEVSSSSEEDTGSSSEGKSSEDEGGAIARALSGHGNKAAAGLGKQKGVGAADGESDGDEESDSGSDDSSVSNPYPGYEDEA